MARIAFINTEYLPLPPVKGGAVEEWIDQIAHQLKGHDVHTFSIYKEAKSETQCKGHITYHWFRPNVLAKIMFCSYKLPFKQDNSTLLFFPYSFWAARKLKKIKPDIIHIHNRPQFVRVFKWLNPKAKIVLHLHQVSAMTETCLWTERMIKSVTLFLGCSQFIANEIKKRYPLTQNKTDFIYNGLDLNKFPMVTESQKRTLKGKHGAGGSTVILYVGRLVENKGPRHLINAVINIIKNKNLNLKLFLCGARGYANQDTTPYIKEMCELIKGYESHIIFTGFIEPARMPEYYQMADITVIPSEVEEGFCVVTTESLSTGTPVIASQKGGIPEIIQNNVSGILLEEVTSACVEEKIMEYFTDTIKFRRMAQTGRQMVAEKFTWERIRDRLENIYRKIL